MLNKLLGSKLWLSKLLGSKLWLGKLLGSKLWLGKLLGSKLLLDKLLLLDRSSKLLRGSRSSSGPDNTKSKRAELWLVMNIWLSLHLLVNVGLSCHLFVHIWQDLRGGEGGSGQAN